MSKDRYITFCRKRDALYPVDQAGLDALSKVKDGAFIAVKISAPRNLGWHRKFFALVKIVFENQAIYPSEEALLAAIKVAVGHCDVIVLGDGKAAYVPRSISFAKMDQAEFEAFWDRVITLVCERIIPKLNRADLEREVMELVS